MYLNEKMGFSCERVPEKSGIVLFLLRICSGFKSIFVLVRKKS